MNKSKVVTIILAASAALFLITSIVSCNGKAKAVEQYNTYRTQARAQITADSALISDHRKDIVNDSLYIIACNQDFKSIAAAASQITMLAGKHSQN